MKPSAFALMRAFEAVGFRFWASGTLRNGRKKIADWYKGEGLTEAGKTQLRAMIPHVEFKIARPQYAPEQRSQVVYIPKI